MLCLGLGLWDERVLMIDTFLFETDGAMRCNILILEFMGTELFLV